MPTSMNEKIEEYLNRPKNADLKKKYDEKLEEKKRRLKSREMRKE